MEFCKTVKVFRPGSVPGAPYITFSTHAGRAERMVREGLAKCRKGKGKRIDEIELVGSGCEDTDEKRRSHGTPGLIGQTYSFPELVEGGHAWRHKDLPADGEIEDARAADAFVRSIFQRVQIDCLTEQVA